MRSFPREVREQLVQEALLYLLWGLLPPAAWPDLELLDALWSVDLLALAVKSPR